MLGSILRERESLELEIRVWCVCMCLRVFLFFSSLVCSLFFCCWCQVVEDSEVIKGEGFKANFFTLCKFCFCILLPLFVHRNKVCTT